MRRDDCQFQTSSKLSTSNNHADITWNRGVAEIQSVRRHAQMLTHCLHLFICLTVCLQIYPFLKSKGDQMKHVVDHGIHEHQKMKEVSITVMSIV